MWKSDFKRLFFSKKTLIIILLFIIIGIISFVVSYNDRQGYINTMTNNYNDINYTKMKNLINNYNGIKFNLDFFLSSDFFQILIIILFLYCGIFLSSYLHSLIESGQENFIISRATYKKHVKNILKTQIFYILAIITISFVIISIIGFLMGGIGSGYSGIGNYEINIYLCIIIVFFQIIITCSLTTLVTLICLLSNVFIKNKLLIQCLPFSLFLIAPMILGSTIGNVYPSIGQVLSMFIPFNFMSLIYWLVQYDFELSFIINIFIPLIVYFSIFQLLYKFNLKKIGNDCL